MKHAAVRHATSNLKKHFIFSWRTELRGGCAATWKGASVPSAVSGWAEWEELYAVCTQPDELICVTDLLALMCLLVVRARLEEYRCRLIHVSLYPCSHTLWSCWISVSFFFLIRWRNGENEKDGFPCLLTRDDERLNKPERTECFY